MYQPTDKLTWKGRSDPLDGDAGKRWHHIIELLDLSADPLPVSPDKKHFALLGFCCDEGVRRNMGRPGAKNGPAAIRKALSNFAVHFDESRTALYDAGDVICPGEDMEAAQEMLAAKVYALLKSGYVPLVMGGGHETAFGHFFGMNKFLEEKRKNVSIINIDAHFDLRRTSDKGNSGTPFLQINELLKNGNRPFHYLVLGVNESSNTKALFNTARDTKTTWIPTHELNRDNLANITHEIDTFVSRAPFTYLSIDLDVIQEAFAPGVSAPASNGLDPAMLLLLVKKIISLGTVVSLDIVELNPAFDIDSRTARLAAQLIYQVITAH